MGGATAGSRIGGRGGGGALLGLLFETGEGWGERDLTLIELCFLGGGNGGIEPER